MEQDSVLFEVRENIAYVTINRPKVLNVFDYSTLIVFEKTLEEILNNQEIRVVIITGAGEKAFSAGADLKERKRLTEAEARRNVTKISEVFDKVASLPQPTIAAVNGYAIGGGFELLLACDLRIASTNVKMGLTELLWGIIPGAGGTQRLPRLIGETKAKELIYTAEIIHSEKAYDLGLLNQVVPNDQLLPVCIELAQKMLKCAPLALKQAKYAINHGGSVDLNSGLSIETLAYEVLLPTNDRIEALQAFSEKRAPNFSGQ